jgi:hypothetical protein
MKSNILVQLATGRGFKFKIAVALDAPPPPPHVLRVPGQLIRIRACSAPGIIIPAPITSVRGGFNYTL